MLLKFLLKSRDVLYHVSSDLGEVKCLYSSFSDTGQNTPWPLKIQKSLVKLIISISWTKFAQKRYFQSIQHIRISIDTKFECKCTFLIFCTKFAQKE